jgi:hypothetical protein
MAASKIVQYIVKRVCEQKSHHGDLLDVGAAASGLTLEFSRAETLKFFGLDFSEKEWRAARWWCVGPGVGAIPQFSFSEQALAAARNTPSVTLNRVTL